MTVIKQMFVCVRAHMLPLLLLACFSCDWVSFLFFWRLRHGMAGTVPPSLSGTCGCIVNGLLYIFGGCCDDGQTNEVQLYSVPTLFFCISKSLFWINVLFQLYSVDLHDGTFSWKKVKPQSGSPPSPRDKLSCWVHKGRSALDTRPLQYINIVIFVLSFDLLTEWSTSVDMATSCAVKSGIRRASLWMKHHG